MYIPRVRTECRNVPATPDPPKARTAHSTSRMNWIEQEPQRRWSSTVSLIRLMPTVGRRSMTGLAAGRPRQACSQTTPGSVKRHARPTGHSTAAVPEHTHAQTSSISIRTVARCRATEGLWGSPNRVRNNHGQTHASRLIANHCHPPRPRPLPLRMAARSGTDCSRRAPLASTRRIGGPPPRDTPSPSVSRCHGVNRDDMLHNTVGGDFDAHWVALLCSSSIPAATSPLAIRQRIAVRPYTKPIPSRVRSTRPRPSAAITTVQISQRRRWAAHDVTAKQGALAAYRRALRNPAAPRLLITADPGSRD